MNLLLRTIPKSGSHYMMALIGNYMAREYFQCGPLDFAALRTHFWESPHPASIPAPKLPFTSEERAKRTGVDRFRFAHVGDERDLDGFDKVIQVYRNPLDTFVSTGHYSRESLNDYRDRLEPHMESYARAYRLIREAPGALTITYEHLRSCTEVAMGKVVTYLGWRYDMATIWDSLRDSGADRLRFAEQQAGVKNVFSSKAHASQVRNGTTGQWRQDMTWREVYRAARVLKRNGIRLNQFYLDG